MNNKSLHQLFIKNAKRFGNKPVIYCNDKFLTYSELDKKSNQVANYLLEKKTKHKLIGIEASRDINAVINLLGILKSGSAYVPIDPDYPAKRKKYILNQSKVKLLLTSNFFENKKNSEELLDKEIKYQPKDNAYVIYTSGSTGNPKGVVISHKAVVNTIVSINKLFKVNSNDRILAVSSLCFDLSVYDLFGSFEAGASFVLVEDNRNVKLLIKHLIKRKITIWNSVPTIIKMMIDSIDKKNKFLNVRLILLSGDWIPISLIGKIRKHFPNARIVSLGGATEASIWSIYYPVKKIDKNWKSIHYGKPLPNQSVYVLNKNLKSCPVKTKGHIYIGGKGLAEEYLNDNKKTNESFIKHPKLGRIYKTGDLGKLLPDGNIELLGRADRQVKIRGIRMMPEEIEVNLRKYKNIEDCIVAPKENKDDKEKYLVAYYTSKKVLMAPKLKKHLRENLPIAMIPDYFVRLDKLPLNANGKIDVKSLPKPTAIISANIEKIKPSTKIEETLTEIWKNILNVKQINTNDNFFDIGGNSLKVVEMATKLGQKGYHVPIIKLFSSPTIKKIARFLDKNTKRSAKKNRKLPGGTPFTAIGDYINNKELNKVEDKPVIQCQVNTIDLTIMKNAILDIKKYYPNFVFTILYDSKDNTEKRSAINHHLKLNFGKLINLSNYNNSERKKYIEKITRKLKKKGQDNEICLSIILLDNNYLILFSKDKKIINNIFLDLLLNIQYLYNIKLADIKANILDENKKIYTPFCSYPEYYNCIHANVLEKIRWENKNKKSLYRSLMPSLDFFCLPNYCIGEKTIRKNNEFNSLLLGYKNKLRSLKILDIKYKIIKFKNKEKALGYITNNSLDNKIALLIGINYYLPSSPYYKDKNFNKLAKNGLNLLPLNISLFFATNNKIKVYSANLNYYGNISKRDLIKYWETANAKFTSTFPLISDDDESFQILVIKNIFKTKLRNIKILHQALYTNVREFFKSKIVTNQNSNKFKKIYFGQHAIQAYKQDILDNLDNKTNAISDIFIIDMTKRFQKTYFHLQDLVTDICASDNIFNHDLLLIKQIIDMWENVFNKLLEKISQKNINYKPRITILPISALHKRKIFTQKDKTELVNSLDKISNLQNKLFISLRNKLKQLKHIN